MIMTQNSSVINEKLLDKIAKLLRLSESPNEHEAELALSKAKQLAVDNDIDLASVSTETNVVEESYCQDKITLGKRKPVTGRFVGWIVNSHFNVSIIYSGSRLWGQHIIFVGKRTDIDISIYVFKYLTQTFMSLWHKYQKNTNSPVSARGSYFYGLYCGLDKKLTEAKLKAEQEKFASLERERGVDVTSGIKNNYSLMIVSNKEKLKEAVSSFFPKLGKVPKCNLNLNNVSAILQGERDGANIEIDMALSDSPSKELEYA